jgi:hypothetical protein
VRHWTWLLLRVGRAFVPAQLSEPIRSELEGGGTVDDRDGTVDDCEAFLAGELAEYRMANREYVSPWEWTNLLAHGSDNALRRESTGESRRASRFTMGTSQDEWRVARSQLARQILDEIDGGQSLTELQRTVLIPAELRMASSPDAALWRPSEWVFALETTLEKHGRTF